jgi:hypothetical protein
MAVEVAPNSLAQTEPMFVPMNNPLTRNMDVLDVERILTLSDFFPSDLKEKQNGNSNKTSSKESPCEKSSS